MFYLPVTFSFVTDKMSGPITRFLGSINREDTNRGYATTDGVVAIPVRLSMSSAAFRESPYPILVPSLMLSPHLYFCLPLLSCSFHTPCRIVLAMHIRYRDVAIPFEFLQFQFIYSIASCVLANRGVYWIYL